MSCLTEQTLSLLTLPGHTAVDDASVLFHPTLSHRLRQHQVLPSCVCSQSLLSGAGKQSVVLQGPVPCPSYRAGLEADFAVSTSHHGLPLFSQHLPSVLSSGDLFGLMDMGPPQGQGVLWKKKMLRKPKLLSRTWSVFLGWSVQGRKVRGKSG